jgi:hypothetical protein
MAALAAVPGPGYSGESVSRRARRGELPEDEFLRALKARGRPPARDLPAGPRARDVPPPPTEAAENASHRRERDPLDEDAERALAEVREEAERRLTEARAAIERERAARVAAEQEAQAAREAAEREHAPVAGLPPHHATADGADAAAQATDALERRIEAVAESERRLREERERWEADAERLAQRRAAELADAEQRIAEARARLHEEQAAAGTQPDPSHPQPAATPAPSPPAMAPQRPRRLARLRLHRGAGADTICATCARQIAGSRSQAVASGWVVNRQGRAICANCQRDGWHFPDGATLPLRSPVGS